jgi:hypothetical protein
VIQHGETVHIGYFESSTVKDGPSGSHERTICTPKQKPRTLSLTCCHIGMVAPSRDWRAISNPIRYSNNERIFISTRQAADLAS